MGVTAIAEDLPSAIQRAYVGVNKLRFEGMHYRKDIGAKALNRIVAVPLRPSARAFPKANGKPHASNPGAIQRFRYNSKTCRK